jgi:hypothetical protein
MKGDAWPLGNMLEGWIFLNPQGSTLLNIKWFNTKIGYKAQRVLFSCLVVPRPKRRGMAV